MRILWLGPVVNEKTMLASRAVSPAANRWQRGLISAIREEGIRISILGHVPEPLWPRGRLRIAGNNGEMEPDIGCRMLEYWNVPALRRRLLCQRYIAAFDRMCREDGKPVVVMTYNDYPQNVVVGLRAQERLNIPWVCVVADGPGSGVEFERHEERINRAAGRVFLSWGRFRDCKQEPKYHLDGGITELHTTVPDQCAQQDNRKPVILFTGAMTKWAGASFLVEAFIEYHNPNAQLWLCGPGSNENVVQAARADPRIKLLGLLSEKRLQEVSKAASIFVNPRPSSISDNRSNFPSKILEYLSYGKPVISTWTDGVSPDYRDLLVLLEEETPDCLASKLDDVLGWDHTKRQAYAQRVTGFATSHKLWRVQAKGLLRWLMEHDFLQPHS